MKLKRSIGFIVLFVMMIFALSVCTYAKPSKAKVRKAYKQYIADNYGAGSGKTFYVDINRDKISELLFIKADDKSQYFMCVVCTYKRGSVVEAGNIHALNGDIYYSPKKKRICFIRRAPWSVSHTEFKLSGGTLKEVAFYHPGMSATGAGGKAIKNGKPISVKKYAKAIKEYEKWKRIKVY